MTIVEAIKSGDAIAVAQLLDADPNLASDRAPDGVSYVSLAMYQKQRDIAHLIAARRTGLDLFEACAIGAQDRVAELLRAEPEAGNSFSPDGFTPIALAAFFGHSEIVELLAKAGVDVNAQARNPMKVAAIHAAVAARDARSVEILLEHGADPNLAQQNDYTPLQAAEANNDTGIVAMLRKHGAR